VAACGAAVEAPRTSSARQGRVVAYTVQFARRMNAIRIVDAPAVRSCREAESAAGGAGEPRSCFRDRGPRRRSCWAWPLALAPVDTSGCGRPAMIRGPVSRTGVQSAENGAPAYRPRPKRDGVAANPFTTQLHWVRGGPPPRQGEITQDALLRGNECRRALSTATHYVETPVLRIAFIGIPGRAQQVDSTQRFKKPRRGLRLRPSRRQERGAVGRTMKTLSDCPNNLGTRPGVGWPPPMSTKLPPRTKRGVVFKNRANEHRGQANRCSRRRPWIRRRLTDAARNLRRSLSGYRGNPHCCRGGRARRLERYGKMGAVGCRRKFMPFLYSRETSGPSRPAVRRRGKKRASLRLVCEKR